MKEKKVFSGKSIALFIFAILALIIGILFVTPISKEIAGINFKNVLTGVVLLLAGLSFIIPSLNKNKNKFRWLLITEIVVVVIVSVFGFILPEFIDGLGGNFLPINTWVSILLILHATVHLVVDRFSGTKLKDYMFLIYIGFAVLGGFILDSKSIHIPTLIDLAIVALFVLVAFLLAYKGYKLPRSTKKIKTAK